MRSCSIPVIIVAALLVAGCQTSTDGMTENIVASEISGPAANTIADDIAGRYAEQAGSTGATIKLRGETSAFATAFEAALKGWGYFVVTDDENVGTQRAAKPIELTYLLVSTEGLVFARLSTHTLELGRTYTVINDVATPASPLSLMKRN